MWAVRLRVLYTHMGRLHDSHSDIWEGCTSIVEIKPQLFRTYGWNLEFWVKNNQCCFVFLVCDCFLRLYGNAAR